MHVTTALLALGVAVQQAAATVSRVQWLMMSNIDGVDKGDSMAIYTRIALPSILLIARPCMMYSSMPADSSVA